MNFLGRKLNSDNETLFLVIARRSRENYISYNEIESDIELQSVGMISLES